MWYEILPSMAIMTVCLAIPTAISPYLFKWSFNGNPFRRRLAEPLERRQFLRDERLTGSAYVLSGLEAIPDGE